MVTAAITILRDCNIVAQTPPTHRGARGPVSQASFGRRRSYPTLSDRIRDRFDITKSPRLINNNFFHCCTCAKAVVRAQLGWASRGGPTSYPVVHGVTEAAVSQPQVCGDKECIGQWARKGNRRPRRSERFAVGYGKTADRYLTSGTYTCNYPLICLKANNKRKAALHCVHLGRRGYTPLRKSCDLSSHKRDCRNHCSNNGALWQRNRSVHPASCVTISARVLDCRTPSPSGNLLRHRTNGRVDSETLSLSTATRHPAHA
ncbi:hypothetical protein EVAR_68515_1 [Eumeta japonica]|uniref:Uncharacterized protein n=1 Tax=Eumeta variegata TaxID=151549 RepID=A0A4C1ZE30_EUMVA|nr:hypothetical protein EVAR_68515_1 [Eumeta japonica]